MNTLILIGLVAAVLLAAIGRLVMPQPQPPQIIYVQVAPVESPSGAGCLPLLILVGLILLVVIGLRQLAQDHVLDRPVAQCIV